MSTWTRAAKANVPLNEECLEAYDVLTANGVAVPPHRRTDHRPVRNHPSGRTSDDRTTPDGRCRPDRHGHRTVRCRAARARSAGVGERSPQASASRASASSIRAGSCRHSAMPSSPEGAEVVIGEVTDVPRRGATVTVDLADRSLTADTAVIATGAWLSKLTKPWVRTPVQAGRGYCVHRAGAPADPGPHLPARRPRRVRRTRAGCGWPEPWSSAPPTIRCNRRESTPSSPPLPHCSTVWTGTPAPTCGVGPRPVTPDGRPLIGEVAQGIYVAGGHGMWAWPTAP